MRSQVLVPGVSRVDTAHSSARYSRSIPSKSQLDNSRYRAGRGNPAELDSCTSISLSVREQQRGIKHDEGVSAGDIPRLHVSEAPKASNQI